MAHRRYYASLNTPFGAWCFPTEGVNKEGQLLHQGLNAPSGAWCFPTDAAHAVRSQPHGVLMHLLVLGAFRRSLLSFRSCRLSVSMHLLVLDAFRLFVSSRITVCGFVSMHLLVLGAFRHVDRAAHAAARWLVSMHLLVPGAFRLEQFTVPALAGVMFQCTFWCLMLSDFGSHGPGGAAPDRLNAPSGAWCFPTSIGTWKTASRASLNAPSGAWCFPTETMASMTNGANLESQCTFWCLVLSDWKFLDGPKGEAAGSQCTFWCLVLSDVSRGR